MRKLRRNEIELIKRLLVSNDTLLEEFTASAEDYFVEDMKDGGMGSVLFLSDSSEKRKLGKTIAEAEFMDMDNVPVMVYLNLDSTGKLFELDVWKVDFSPVTEIQI